MVSLIDLLMLNINSFFGSFPFHRIASILSNEDWWLQTNFILKQCELIDKHIRSGFQNQLWAISFQIQSKRVDTIDTTEFDWLSRGKSKLIYGVLKVNYYQDNSFYTSINH